MSTSGRMTDADLNAYVDGELDEVSRIELETWLADHPDDAARVEAYRQQNEGLQDLFGSAMDEPVPMKMLDLVKKPRSAKSVGRPTWTQFAAAVALLLAGSAGGWSLRGLQDTPQIAAIPTYVERAIGAYTVFAADAARPVEISADREDYLVAWLSKRLGNPLKAPDLESLGYQLVGGRLLEDSGRPAAQFMYEDNLGARVAVYVRTYEGKDTAFKFFDKAGISVFYWIDTPLAYALAADLPRQELERISRLVYRNITSQNPNDN